MYSHVALVVEGWNLYISFVSLVPGARFIWGCALGPFARANTAQLPK